MTEAGALFVAAARKLLDEADAAAGLARRAAQGRSERLPSVSKPPCTCPDAGPGRALQERARGSRFDSWK